MSKQVRRNMIDLETFGTSAGSPIASIGAVEFDENSIKSKFYVNVDIAKSPLTGFDGDTVKWWMKQSKEAQGALTASAVSLEHALIALTVWLGDDKGEIWGNGASFDNVLLRAAYEACGLPVPWKFWNDRCFRTVKNLYPDVKEPSRKGVHHNALYDAEHQAKWLLKIHKQRGIFVKPE